MKAQRRKATTTVEVLRISVQTKYDSPSQPASVSSSASRRSLLTGVFSFPVMCMFLIALAIFCYSPRGIAESDIWWHMRNARQLLQYHSFPSVDTYSFSAAGSPWINFEWLSEIPFFLAFRALGLQGILSVYIVVLVLIYAGVYYRCCRAGADCKDAAVVTMGALCLGGVSMAPRMLLFGWLCMMGLLLALDRFQRTGKGLWVLPPLFAVWINLHGSWVFGIMVLAITMASGLVEGEWGSVVARRWTSRDLKKLVAVLAASVAALFVNPFGYKLVLYPFELLLRHTGVMQNLEEWQPVDFSTAHGRFSLALIFALVAAALLSRLKWRLDEVILTAFALWAGLSHSRFLFFVGLIVAPILAPRLHLFPPYERELDKRWLNAGIMASVLAAMFFFFPSSAQLQKNVDDIYPTAALKFIERQHITGRIFNQYGWGGYMEWHAAELRPFIDGRADIFVYNGVFADYLQTTGVKHPFEILDKYKIDYVFIQPSHPLVYVLEHSPAWRPIYTDKVAVLLERVSGVAAKKLE